MPLFFFDFFSPRKLIFPSFPSFPPFPFPQDLPPLPFIPLSSFIGVPVPISNAPILIPGNVFQGIFPVNLIATLYFLPKCQSITIHAEMISRSSNLTNDFISTFSVIASVVSQQQITDFTFFGPEAVEVLAIQTLQVPLDSSGFFSFPFSLFPFPFCFLLFCYHVNQSKSILFFPGTVISVCPLPGTEDSFLFLLLNGYYVSFFSLQKNLFPCHSPESLTSRSHRWYFF